MKIDEVYPSNYLKASDLKGKLVKVKMKAVTVEEIGDDKKPVIRFEGRDKGLALNKTNAGIIASAYGQETDAWNGKEIELRPDKTQFQGQLVDCIRVQVPAQAAGPDDDIPF